MLKLLSGEFAVKVINILSRHRLLEKIDMLHTNEVINLTSDPIVNLSMLISQKTIQIQLRILMPYILDGNFQMHRRKF